MAQNPHITDAIFEQVTALATTDARPSTMPPPISFQAVYNWRDLGGWTAQAGRTVRSGQFYRSANLAYLTEHDLETLRRLGIWSVIDLRSDTERQREPDRLPEGVQYFAMPMQDVEGTNISIDYYLGDIPNLERRLSQSYIDHLVDGNAQRYGQVLTLLAQPDTLPAIVHCTAGKDRTGFAAAILLLALGVDDKAIVADYTLSNLSAAQFFSRMHLHLNALGLENLSAHDLMPLLAAPAERMQGVLEHLVTRYGSVEHYLTMAAGVTAATLEALRAAFFDV